MVRGFVLISVEPGKEMEAYRGFSNANGIVEATPLLGDIDFLLIIEAKEPNDIARIVIKQIRPIKGVVSTKTLVEDEFLKHFEGLASDKEW
ncbi:MAG: Lrp/AsnC ligand binding domain-containing protein [Thermoplasmata archaeon]|nr:Lrp/AsnC ligand binding domain-containing protein [Thermoplasmata archaeon]